LLQGFRGHWQPFGNYFIACRKVHATLSEFPQPELLIFKTTVISQSQYSDQVPEVLEQLSEGIE
jgi:hypothetical protein